MINFLSDNLKFNDLASTLFPEVIFSLEKTLSSTRGRRHLREARQMPK